MRRFFDFSQLDGIWPECLDGSLGYDATSSQRLILDYASQFDHGEKRRKATRILISGGERSGKTMTMVRLAAERIVPLMNGEIWIIGGDYFHTRVEFDLLAGIMDNLGLLDDQFRPREGSWEMKLTTGTTITTRTSYDTAKIAAVSLDGVMMCEVGKQSEEAWRKSRGRVLDRDGWVIGSGTIEEGFQWWNDILKSWHYDYESDGDGQSEHVSFRGRAFYVPTWTNNRVFPRDRHVDGIEGIEDVPDDQPYVWVNSNREVIPSDPDGWPNALKAFTMAQTDEEKPQLILLNQALHDERASMSESRFWERYGAVPSKPTNLVIPNFNQAVHVQEIEVETDALGDVMPIQLWIDPGHKIYAVLMVQIIHSTRVHIIDELYFRNAIVEDVIPEVMSHPLWAHVRGGVIDFAGRQHAATKSQIERWRETSGLRLDSKRWAMEDTWNAVQFWLKRDEMTTAPKLVFSESLNASRFSKTEAGGIITEFDMWKWPKRSAERNAASRPISNNNHSIMALAYGLLFNFGPTGKRDKRKRQKLQVKRGAYSYGREPHPVGHMV